MVSGFSAVDHSPEPQRLMAFLDKTAVTAGAMKQYVAAAHALRRPDAFVLDLGCGLGHDLELLAALGVAGVGIEPSSIMIETARARTQVPIVRATGEHLPFRDGAFAGCRAERVLMHVVEPEAVLTEVFRCVRPGGLVTLFEPDWTSLHIEGAAEPWVGWLSNARHPAIGRQLGAMLTAAGATVVDRVEERSWWTWDRFCEITNLDAAVPRAVEVGKISASAAQQWLAEQRERASAGTFRARIEKVLWVATTPNLRDKPSLSDE